MRISDWSSDLASGITGSDSMEIRIMSEGETILGAIRQLRELHRNVSLLLKTADSAMTEKGWVNAKSDATALHEMSYSINSRSEEHTSELQSLMRISYAVFCLKKKKKVT